MSRILIVSVNIDFLRTFLRIKSVAAKHSNKPRFVVGVFASGFATPSPQYSMEKNSRNIVIPVDSKLRKT